jgi:hypothetical protein
MLGLPLLLIPFAIYNIIAFLMPGVTWARSLNSDLARPSKAA